MRLKIFATLGIIALLFYAFNFWKLFENRFEETGLLTSRLSYLMSEEVLANLQKESTHETKNGIRIFSLKILDSCRFYVLDFPNLEEGFRYPEINSTDVYQKNFDFYSSLETATFNFSINVGVDTLNVNSLNIDSGDILQIRRESNSMAFSSMFKKMSFGTDKYDHDLIIESPFPSLQSNVFLGKFEDKVTLCLFFTQSAKAIDLDLFSSWFKDYQALPDSPTAAEVTSVK